MFAESWLGEEKSDVNMQPSIALDRGKPKGTPVLVLSYKQIDFKKFLARILKSHLSLKSYLSILCFAIQLNGRSLPSCSRVVSCLRLARSRNRDAQNSQNTLQPVEQPSDDDLFLLPSQTLAFLFEQEQALVSAPHFCPTGCVQPGQIREL